jgi:hypothetical protein
MPLEELHAVFPGGGDHAVAFAQVHRHGFLADHMLAVTGGTDGMLGMQRVGGGNPHRVDVVLGAELGDRGIGRAIMGLCEGIARLGPDVGTARQLVGRPFAKGGQHLAGGDADPGDADAQWCRLRLGFSGALAAPGFRLAGHGPQAPDRRS